MNDFQFAYDPDPYMTVDGFLAHASSTEWIESDAVMEVRR